MLLPLPQGCLEGTRSALEIAAYTLGGLGIAFGIVEVCLCKVSFQEVEMVTKNTSTVPDVCPFILTPTHVPRA